MPSSTSDKKIFRNWLIFETREIRKFISLSALAGWLIALAILIYRRLPIDSMTSLSNVFEDPEFPFTKTGFALAQACICFLLAFLTPPATSVITRDTNFTMKAAARIRRHVIYLYLSLSVLYFAMSFFYYRGLPPGTDNCLTVFEIVTASFIFFLYVELSQITVSNNEESSFLIKGFNRSKLFFSALALILIIISILSYAFPGKDQNIEHKDFLIQTIKSVAAFLSGCTLAMVIGRLGNAYLYPGTFTIFLLYFYAILQALTSGNESIRFLVILLALPLKIILWLVFVWTFTNGKMSHYVGETRNVLDSEKSQVL
jgi:hypothetical protein